MIPSTGLCSGFLVTKRSHRRVYRQAQFGFGRWFGNIFRDRERERDRETERETERQRDRERQTETGRQREALCRGAGENRVQYTECRAYRHVAQG